MPSNNTIYYVKVDPILQVSSQEPSTFSKSRSYPISAKSYPILIELLLIFDQSTKFQNHSSAELSLLNICDEQKNHKLSEKTQVIFDEDTWIQRIMQSYSTYYYMFHQIL